MDQEQRDRLIDRYMGRRMSPAEERDFLRLLDSDDILRRMVETERAVGATLLRDRDGIPAADLESRTHLLSLLARLPNGNPGNRATGGNNPFPSAAGLPGGRVIKGILGLVVVGIMVMTSMMLLRGGDSEQAANGVPSATAVHEQRSAEKISSVAPPAAGVVNAAAPIASPQDTRMPATPAQAPLSAPALPSARVKRAAGHDAPVLPEPPRTRISSPKSSASVSISAPATSAIAPPADDRSTPSVRTRDSMHVKVSINLDRLQHKP